MKIEKLTDHSVKIEFSIPEMEKRSLNVNKLNVDAPAYKKLVEDMVSFAEIELGCKIGSASVQYKLSDKEPVICFIVESVISNKNGAAGYNAPDNIRNGSQEAQESPKQGLPGGNSIDLAAEFLGRVMMDSFLTFQALASKSRSGLDLDSSGEPELPGAPDLEEDQGEGGPGKEQMSISAALEMRRKVLFGEGYRTEGGTGVVAFPTYNDLYGFVKSNCPENTRSRLFEYRDVFYLVVFAGKKGAKKLVALDSLAGEYRGVVVPSEAAMMILAEYGETVFEKDAIRRVRESLG